MVWRLLAAHRALPLHTIEPRRGRPLLWDRHRGPHILRGERRRRWGGSRCHAGLRRPGDLYGGSGRHRRFSGQLRPVGVLAASMAAPDGRRRPALARCRYAAGRLSLERT